MPLIETAGGDGGIVGVKLLISGMSGAGKTTLATTAPDPLVLLTEKQGRAVIRAWKPETPIINIDTAADLRLALRALRKAKVVDHPDGRSKCLAIEDDGRTFHVRTVILDSVTDLQRSIKNELLGMETEGADGSAQSSSSSKQREVLTQQEWGILIDRTERIVQAFRDLPCNVVALFLAKEIQDGDDVLVRPQLWGKALPGSIQQYFIGAGYLFRSEQEEVGEDGKKRTVVKRAIKWDGGTKFLVKPFPGAPTISKPDLRECLIAYHKFANNGHDRDDVAKVTTASDDGSTADPATSEPTPGRSGRRKSKTVAQAMIEDAAADAATTDNPAADAANVQE